MTMGTNLDVHELRESPTLTFAWDGFRRVLMNYEKQHKHYEARRRPRHTVLFPTPVGPITLNKHYMISACSWIGEGQIAHTV
jgi:hypothetical protein